jgi:selenocysteine-specific elongation factor
MPVVGTAGHVDHGKSTLVERITGRNPDRWAEEKRRGLTIDLGFAWARLAEIEVSFVDVPGHERFLKNMLAGIEAIDVALFVVAADEGWMPQSEEHLAVLDLLEVSRGVVALTKTDLVDGEMLELAAAEVADRLSGTSLHDAPIVPVSGVTGAGVDHLVELLAGLLPGEPELSGRPRLWVDRSFTMAGAGTIVTGTLLDSGLSVDDTVEIYPSGLTARIRGIQSHEQSHRAIGPGRRVALNLGGVGHDQIERGQMVGLPGQWRTSRRFAVTLATARYVDVLDQRGAYQLHIGSASHRVAITGAGGTGAAVVKLDAPVPVAVGDRFIMRDTGRGRVVAGGRVLDPAPGRTGAALHGLRGLDPGSDPNVVAGHLLRIRREDELDRIAAHSRGGVPNDAIVTGTRVVALGLVEELATQAIELVAKVHATHPLRNGMPMATLARSLGTTQPVLDVVIDRTGSLERRGPDVAAVGHAAALSTDQERDWTQAVERLRGSLAVPAESELGVDQEVIGSKIRAGELVRVAPGLVYLPSQIEEIKSHMAAMSEGFTVAQFRDSADVSRRFAVPILEWADKEGLTVRRGDLRRFR